MADRGFTVKDMLHTLNIELTLPPFIKGLQQLQFSKVQDSQGITSLRIQVERVKGEINNFTILKETLPITLAQLANQIVCVCLFI